jgi:hypothetical protein
VVNASTRPSRSMSGKIGSGGRKGSRENPATLAPYALAKANTAVREVVRVPVDDEGREIGASPA